MAEPRVPVWARQFALFISTLTHLVPARLSDLLSAAMARLVYWKGHAQHSRVLQDFRDNVDPTAQLSGRTWRPVRAMYRALVRNASDAVWFLTASRGAALRRFRIVDRTPIDTVLQQGHRGAVVVFPHLGSYAALPAVLALNGVPTTVVANRQRGLMQWVMARSAGKAGLELVAVDRERGQSITAAMEDAIARGRVVAIAGDYHRAREGGGSGVEVRLAGTTRTVGPGPALLALRTGAAIVPGVVFQDRHRREPVLGAPIIVGDPVARDDPRMTELVQTTTQAIADALAQFIGHRPEQWVMPGGLVSNVLGRRASGDR